MWTNYPEIAKDLKSVEEYIKKSITSRNKLLSSAVAELIDAGGKRLRPAFVILSAKFGRYDKKKIMPAAGALEILHTATLVHDDVIDNSKYRRGKLTVSAKFGTDMAIYTGDFLFTKAVLMLSKDVPANRMDIMAKAIKVICEGEVDQYQDRFRLNISVVSYLKRINRKTAVLFGAACGFGSLLAKCNPHVVRSLSQFGIHYGMAFQIRDDLYDFISNTETVGKPVGHDITKGVVTLPVIYALKKSSSFRAQMENYVKNNGDVSSSQVPDIVRLVHENDGIEDTKLMLDKYIKKGLKILDSLPDNKYKRVLEGLIKDLKV